MNDVVCMFITLASTILSGVFNMLFCKMPILKSFQRPMDGEMIFCDGKRILGDNKTWKGFMGYIFLNSLFFILWGLLCKQSNFLTKHNYFYFEHENKLTYNLLIGFLLGLAYAVFELPNSFIKRRLDICPGKPAVGFKKYFFIFFDQADSLFGCALVVWMFYDIGIIRYIGFILIGSAVHITLNVFLYCIHLRKNFF